MKNMQIFRDRPQFYSRFWRFDNASGPQAIPPISRAPGLMSDSDYNDFFGEFPHDDVVREALEEESFGSCRTCQVSERDDFVFEKVNGGVDRMIEFLTKPRMLMLVPYGCLNRLYRGLFKDSYPAH